MPVESDADRAVFLNSDEFGDSAVYTKAAGGSAPIAGIFDAPHIAIEFGESTISDRRPTFFCRTADIPSGAVGGDGGDTLLVDGIAYKVADIEHDAQGMTRIVLGRS